MPAIGDMRRNTPICEGLSFRPATAHPTDM